MPLEPGETSDEGWWTVADVCRALGWSDQRVHRYRNAPLKFKERPEGQRPRWLVWGPDVRTFAKSNAASLGPGSILSFDTNARVVEGSVADSGRGAPETASSATTTGSDPRGSHEQAALQATVDVLFDALVASAATAAEVAKRHHETLAALRRVFHSLDAAATAKIDPDELRRLLSPDDGSANAR